MSRRPPSGWNGSLMPRSTAVSWLSATPGTHVSLPSISFGSCV
jgi:hypothetical protein